MYNAVSSRISQKDTTISHLRTTCPVESLQKRLLLVYLKTPFELARLCSV
jgi:hypothetical protein